MIIDTFSHQDYKEKTIQTIEKSTNEKWLWLKKEPKALGFFSKSSSILASAIKRVKNIPGIDIASLLVQLTENLPNVLHLLAQEPVNEDKSEAIMYFLQAGVKPNLRYGEGNFTFLQMSANIKHSLLKKINSSPDNWPDDIFKSWTTYNEGKL